MKNKQIIYIVFLIVSLTGCGSIPSKPVTLTASPTQLENTISYPVVTPTWTEEVLKSIPVLVPTPTPAPLNQTIIQNCSDGNSPLRISDSLVLPGTILVDDGEKGLLLGGSPDQITQIPIKEKQPISYFGFSPNGKWLAYSAYTPYINGAKENLLQSMKVVLLSSDGRKIEHTLDILHSFPEFGLKENPNGFPAYWMGQWINDHLLYLEIFYLGSNLDTQVQRINALLDPIEGRWRNDLLIGYPTPYAYTVALSPDQSRILYKDPAGMEMWDVQQKIEFGPNWAIGDHGNFIFMKWSPDSTKVVYFYPGETVYLTDRDDEERTEITSDNYPVSGLFAPYAKWSSDGRYLAFVQSFRLTDSIQTIFVYDTQDKKFTYQCAITGVFLRGPSLQWSPDGKYLAVSSDSPGLYTKDLAPIYILEFENGKVFELAQKGNVHGWTDSFPIQAQK